MKKAKYTSVYTESYDKNTNTGEKYERAIGNKFEMVIWEHEQKILGEIFDKYFKDKRNLKYLDFACGTGRVISFFVNKIEAENITGIDTSKKMLAEAESKYPSVQFINGNIATDDSLLNNKTFDLITSFRLFLNLESENRKILLSKLTPHLSKDGYIIFNNHMNRYSILGFIAFIMNKVLRIPLKREAPPGKKGIINTMTHREVLDLIDAAKLELVETYKFSLIPAHGSWIALPSEILLATEKKLSRIAFLNNLGKDRIYVCKRK
jgi:ubiquinone/menaquinone biosynthesis C-methylase UbiE